MIHIGTSGWVYGDWGDGVFYPEDLREKDWLEFYSQQFKTVEINATFYHQMSAKTYANWYNKVPKDFIFSVKISRFLTHIKKLNAPKEPWQRFINNAKHLKEKLGPILVQLPPNLHVNLDKLKELIRVIPAQYKIALEVRHQSWFNEPAYKILKKRNISLVFSYGEGLPVEEVITADFIYVRMHGPGDLYGSKYTTAQLKKLADKIKQWQRKVKNIYVYFNNDTKGYAVDNAKKLIELTK
jgi:uncharacterized protein YecE (DUF72 family)